MTRPFDPAALSIALALSIASAGVAQVAPPPSETKDDTAQQTEQNDQQDGGQSAQETTTTGAAQPAGGEDPIRYEPDNPNVRALPTDMPYPKLIQRNEDGKIRRLRELPDILALRANPTVGPRSVDLIMPVIYARRTRFEQMIINNLDLYWMVTDGRLDNIDMSDMQELTQLTEMIKPLVGQTSLSAELQNRVLLTRVQGGMNRHIVNEYKQAIHKEIQFESDQPLLDLMTFILEDSLHETKLAYRAMLAEALIDIDQLVEEAGLTSPAAQKLAAFDEPLETELTALDAQLERFDALFRELSVEEGIALFETMRQSRPSPDISPAIERIDVMRPGKIDKTDSPGLQGTVTDHKTGTVVDTRDARERFEKIRKERAEAFAQRGNAENADKDDKDKDKDKKNKKADD